MKEILYLFSQKWNKIGLIETNFGNVKTSMRVFMTFVECRTKQIQWLTFETLKKKSEFKILCSENVGENTILNNSLYVAQNFCSVLVKIREI